MLTKILFTALVIVVVFTVARIRSGAVSARAVVLPGSASKRRRVIAYLVAAALLLGAVGGYAIYWSRWHEVVSVRVTNTQSGESTTYQVHQGSIHEREFETTDGWKVTVSDHERVEIRGE